MVRRSYLSRKAYTSLVDFGMKEVSIKKVIWYLEAAGKKISKRILTFTTIQKNEPCREEILRTLKLLLDPKLIFCSPCGDPGAVSCIKL